MAKPGKLNVPGLIGGLLLTALAGPLPAQEPPLEEIRFQPSSLDFPNPERGWYRYREMPASGSFGFDLRGGNGTLAFLKIRADAPKPVILRHIAQLAPLWKRNKEVIHLLDPGFIGGWGEWHTSSNGLDNKADRTDILFAILDSLPADRMTYIRYSGFKREIFGGTQASESPILGGETCALHARGECANALAEMAALHIDHLNRDYHEDVIARWRSQGCLDTLSLKLGHRLALEWAQLPAAPFPEDPRRWAGGTVDTVEAAFTLPADLAEGAWRFGLRLADADTGLAKDPRYSIRLANPSVWNAALGINDLKTDLRISKSAPGPSDPDVTRFERIGSPVHVRAGTIPGGWRIREAGYGRLEIGAPAGGAGPMEARLVTLAGGLVKTWSVPSPGAGRGYSLSLPALAKGVYLLSVSRGRSRAGCNLVVGERGWAGMGRGP